MSIYGCDNDPGNFTFNECERINGRVRGVILMNADGYAAINDFSDGAEINAQIAAGNGYLINKTQGDYPKPTPNDGEGFGDNDAFTISASHTLNFKHPTIKDNRDFYNVMNTNTTYHVLWRVGETGDDLLFVSTVPVNLFASPVVESDLASQVLWDITCTWTAQDIPLIETAPTGVFTA